MTTAQPGFLLGIGSNINPNKNVALIIDSLLDHFPAITVSRVLKIPPIGMNSQHDFLNVVVFIETAISKDGLKAICNNIETKLGRDRSDPASKTKDRPADLDIFLQVNSANDFNRSVASITDEYFIYPLLEEIIAFITNKPLTTKQQGVALTINNLTFGQAATTIHRNACPGNERIIE